ncbi:synaptosome-associated proteinsynaptosomal-associated protein 25 [Vararia minispora EC-137]|uniref:Synaptosome-associated proteinsynaptosomal-associated protein 25 n=1 Tax=Vararia minispora EC-137 TaxID=1314806 RepID=A0ACB8QDE9_9AGAM|nr:synaptosome-associated proteinsynaptosomal-associated protein 25 [Vararia minispora EC-137]
MSWFNKRKDGNLIPPVESDSTPSYRSAAPSYRSGSSNSSLPPVQSTAATYIPSRDGGSYGSYNNPRGAQSSPMDSQALMDKYQRNKPVGDAYSRGQGNLEQDRNELFSGFNPQKAQNGRFTDGPGIGHEPPPGEENDEDVEGIKQQTRFLKQDSVNSTRNALRLAREAEETARSTIGRLGDQSEKLANTERHLDVAKGHSQRAMDKTDELKKLNRSIFRPAISFNKDAKRAAQEAKVQQRYDEERNERERAMMDIRDTQNRLGRAGTYGTDDDGEGIGRRRNLTASQQAMRKEQRKRYQFEATASDDEMEDEIDDNLDEIGDMAKRLGALGRVMGQELDKQNERIDRLGTKAGELDNHVFRNTEKVRSVTVVFTP